LFSFYCKSGWRTLVLKKNKLFNPRFAAPVVGFSSRRLKLRRQLAEVEMCGTHDPVLGHLLKPEVFYERLALQCHAESLLEF
jgi:hypothetical protein